MMRFSLTKAIRYASCSLGGAALMMAANLFPTAALALTTEQAAGVWQLVRADMTSGKTKRAIRRLEWLVLNDYEAPNRVSHYQKALRALTNEAPLSFGLSGTVLPSTNVHRSSSQDVFETDIGTFTLGSPETDESGFGLRLSGSTSYRHAYAAGRDVTASFRLSGTYYDDAALRYTSQTFRLAHRWHLAGKRYTVSTSASRAIYPEIDTRSAPDNWSRSIGLSAAYVLADSQSLALNFTLRERTYIERSYLDGITTHMSALYTRPITSKGTLALSAGLSNANLSADHYSYDGLTLGARYRHKTKDGLTWSAGYSLSLRDYDDIFTALSYARFDQSHTLSMSLSHDNIRLRDMIPRLTCKATHQNSNVALYSYDAVDCSVGLNFDF